MKESQLHKACADYLHLVENRHDDFLWYTVANEGPGANKVRAAKFKAVGVRPGVADIMILHSGKAIAIELKTAKGVISEKQKVFAKSFTQAGGEYFICRSLNQLETILNGRGLNLPKTEAA